MCEAGWREGRDQMDGGGDGKRSEGMQSKRVRSALVMSGRVATSVRKAETNIGVLERAKALVCLLSFTVHKQKRTKM